MTSLGNRLNKAKERMDKVNSKLVEDMKMYAAKEGKPQEELTHGVKVEQLRDVVIEKQRMAEYNQAQFNAQLIAERQNDINQIEALMDNLAGIIQSIAEQVQQQDEKFEMIGQHARTTKTAAKKARQELILADDHRGLGNQKMYFLLSFYRCFLICCLCLVIIMLFLIFK